MANFGGTFSGVEASGRPTAPVRARDLRAMAANDDQCIDALMGSGPKLATKDSYRSHIPVSPFDFDPTDDRSPNTGRSRRRAPRNDTSRKGPTTRITPATTFTPTRTHDTFIPNARISPKKCPSEGRYGSPPSRCRAAPNDELPPFA